jgi:para-aminobenzoate synthetase component 1
MKGTIDASIENAEQLILQDDKETAEHYTIVDLIRNDISIVATHVQVEKFRYIDTIKTSNKTLLQVSSKIVGELPTNYLEQLGNIIFSLLPAGSISGAPKKKTLEIIQEAEKVDRGFYTGTCFYFDGKSIDSCVLIRFIEQTSNGLVYKSGGGITINSDVEKEYQELIDKIYVPTL